MPLTYNPHEIPQQEYTEPRRLHFYEKGENIPVTNQGLWEVYKGVVLMSKNHRHGEEVLLGWAKSTAFIGSFFNYDKQHRAKALSDVYLKWYTNQEIQNSQYLVNNLLNQMVIRMEQAENLLTIANHKRVETRLKQLLLLLKLHLGQPCEEGIRLEVRLTHQHLASAIGTTRVTVTRLLKDIQSQELITMDKNRHLIILDRLTRLV